MHEHREREFLGVSQGANDMRGFNTEEGLPGSAARRACDRRGGPRDGIANQLGAGQYSFHDESCVALGDLRRVAAGAAMI